MNYNDGMALMKKKLEELEESGQQSDSFNVGSLVINYPGKKKQTDYRVTENGIAPTHADIVSIIYNLTTKENFEDVVAFLDDVYLNGTDATNDTFNAQFKEKIFWLTLQEQINYPFGSGRRLPFHRYYEAAQAKLDNCKLGDVINRTNNHGKERPSLYDFGEIKYPSFYKL